LLGRDSFLMSTRDQQEREQGNSDDQGAMSHILIDWRLKCCNNYTVHPSPPEKTGGLMTSC